MVCARGRAAPDRATERRLFASSGGFCQNPNCFSPLFLEAGARRVDVAEMAHILAASTAGPRANSALTAAQCRAYENLILLCPTCHTFIDKAPDEFPDSLLLT